MTMSDLKLNSKSTSKPSEMGAVEKPRQKPETPASSSNCFANSGISRTLFLRIAFVSTLIIAAAVCGLVSFKIITSLEEKIGEETYYSIATSALVGAQDLTLRRIRGLEVTATILSYAYPNESQWPNVALNGYQHIAKKVADLSDSKIMGLISLVAPDEVEEFEQHAMQIFEDQNYPDDAGYQDFGFGIWKRSIDSPNEDGKLHDTTGETTFPSDYQILAPILEHNRIGTPALMYNVHSEEFRGKALDSMMKCVEDASKENATNTPECWVVTDWVNLVTLPDTPAGLGYLPIFPANDPTTIVGMISNSLIWEVVLKGVVPDYVNGLTCVFSTNTNSWTYEIKNGNPEFVGEGDRHELQYDHFGKNITLTNFTTGASASATYTLTVYPTNVMFERFRSKSALAVSLGFLGVIALCSSVFYVYDFLMRQESNNRKLVLEIKRRFVRFISHEIRTPLNTVSMGLELLQSEFREQEDNAKDPAFAEDIGYWLDVLSDIRENNLSAVEVLNDLLNYDKIETKSLKIEIGRVKIWDLLEKTVNQFRIQAINKHVDLTLNVEEQPVTDENDVEENKFSSPENLENRIVIGDDVRLMQVIRNLISNSLKFSPAGGNIEVTVSHNPNGLPKADLPLDSDGATDSKGSGLARAYDRSGSIVIQIKDDGIGMSKAQLGQLFSEGVQFDANKLQHGGGSGLGLVIAKGIVENHNGRIAVRSPGIGEGSTFAIELPLYEYVGKEIEDIDMEKSHATVMTRETVEEEVSRHILVVEDTISSQKMLVRLLERSGHSCITACNGKEAIAAMVANRSTHKNDPGRVCIDTVLMDFEMPEMNGPEATLELRKLGYEGIIFGVTANLLSEDVEYFLNQGANEVLPKPINMSLLNTNWKKHDGN